MIRVVAAMGREIEGDREALLSGRKVAAVEGVGILRGREPRILAHGPGLRGVHGRVGPAQIGRDARIGIEEVEARQVVGAVGRFHRDAFGGEPGALRNRPGAWSCLGKGDGREIRDRGHDPNILPHRAERGGWELTITSYPRASQSAALGAKPCANTVLAARNGTVVKRGCACGANVRDNGELHAAYDLWRPRSCGHRSP